MMPAVRVAGEENRATRAARGRGRGEFCKIVHQREEISVDGKGLALRAVAPRGRIEHEAVVACPAAQFPGHEGAGVFADPADWCTAKARGLGIAPGQRDRLPRGIDVHDLRARGGHRQRGGAGGLQPGVNLEDTEALADLLGDNALP